MLIHFTKFIHVLLVLSLLIATFSCLVLDSTAVSITYFRKHHKLILILSLLAALTGTALIYPKHFTFATPWIQAAYLFVMIFMVGILVLMRYNTKKRWFRLGYLLLSILLIVVVHDAVMKKTFLL
jgi:hypothetical protein